jgi:hypothetical protein
MNFYKLTSMGGLSVNLEPYCEKLTLLAHTVQKQKA